jgi:hypothetical protein
MIYYDPRPLCILKRLPIQTNQATEVIYCILPFSPELQVDFCRHVHLKKENYLMSFYYEITKIFGEYFLFMVLPENLLMAFYFDVKF